MTDVGPKAKPKYEQIVEDINKLPGMSSIKNQVEGLVSQAVMNKARENAGLPPEPVGNNMLLTGNPGTGKTIITRKMGELMFELGLTTNPKVVQVSRMDLVGPFSNTAAQTANEIITKNRGKTIFIDEAYSLYNGPQDLEGRQVVDEIMRLAEEYRDDTAIVLAGYQKEMDEFVKVNPGLKSRFPTKMHLPDYTPAEKKQVLNYTVETANRTFESKATKQRAGQYAAVLPSGGDKGNARAVRNFYDAMRDAHARRLAVDPASIKPADLSTFSREDVEIAAANMGLPPIVKVRRPKPQAESNRRAAAQRIASPRRRRASEVVAEQSVA